MAAMMYQCPTTGLRVQAWFGDRDHPQDGETYEQLTCLACRGAHFINPKTGRVLDRGPFRTCVTKD